jgi:hypothetical protein
MGQITMTREIAWACATDEGDRSMKQAGRTEWSYDDLDAARREFDRLWPITNDFRTEEAAKPLFLV